MDPKFNLSEEVLNRLNPIKVLTQSINPFNWMDHVAASATNYVDKGIQGDYDVYNNPERGFANKLLGTSRSLTNKLVKDQTDRYIKGNPEGRALARSSKDYGIDLKDEKGSYQRLDTLIEDVGIGNSRYQQLSEAGLIPSQLNLPENTKFATAPMPVFDKHFRSAKTKLKNDSDAAKAGIDPSTLNGTAATNEAIRKKQTADEIEKATAERDAYEKSAKGQREAATAARGLDLIDEEIASSQATTRINQGTLDLSRVNAENTQTLNLYDRDVDKYRYEDGKIEKGLDRQYDADREDARFAANLETIKLQNAAEMERYEMMLQNDKEVRQGDSISDLMSALTMLGGAFML